MSKDLIEVYNEVANDIKNGYFVNSLGEEIYFPEINSSRLAYYSNLDEEYLSGSFENPLIYVENRDFLNKGIELSSEKTLILNPASDVKAGGGVRKGSKALEEIICRRSNLLKSLELYANSIGYYRRPLSPGEGILSKNVTIYKNANYDNFEVSFPIDIFSSAAPRHPELTREGKYTRDSEDDMKLRIQSFLRVAILFGKSKLVIPAWGCGAFYNPASEVARCFDEVLHEEEFKNEFEEICFAILDDHNAVRADNPEGNYKPFLDRFGEKPY